MIKEIVQSVSGNLLKKKSNANIVATQEDKKVIRAVCKVCGCDEPILIQGTNIVCSKCKNNLWILEE